MPPLSYQQAGLVLKRPGTGASDAQIRDLQRHQRARGYLRQGIDGAFGSSTEGGAKTGPSTGGADGGGKHAGAQGQGLNPRPGG